MSSRYLSHGVRNFIEDFDERIYDNVEHRNLYILDLDCDYAIEILKQAHSRRMFIAPTKWLLLQNRDTETDNNVDINSTFTYDDSIFEIFEDLAVYPDSDVVLARRFYGNFIELISIYRPSPQRGVIWEDRGNWTVENGLRMKTFDMASARRRNLQQTTLKSSIVLTNPDTINHLTDFMYRTTDAITKANYPWILYLINRMNATVSFDTVDNWGHMDNGTWNGMIGMLHRREIDIGGTCTHITTNQIGVVQYVQLYTRSGLKFIFRRPLLSTMKNIFTLPFQRNVWIAIAVFLLLVSCLLYLSMKWEHYRGASTKSAAYWNQLNIGEPTVGDDILVLLGAFAQQGYSYEPYKISTRIVTLMLLMASLSLYAAYTANIVGLLQSTTDSIKTLPDLLHSPLSIGAQDIVFNRYYFRAFQDPVRKAILEQKLEPKGRKSGWMSLEEGVRRIKDEPFAFHAVRGTIYQVIQSTYREDEKCGLTEIDYVQLPYPLLVIQKQSPYSEIIKNGALKLQEHGLKNREEYRMYATKPTCSTQTGFITIGFTECYFAIVIMGYGTSLSIIVFAFELLWYKRQNKNMTEETPPDMVEETDSGIVER